MVPVRGKLVNSGVQRGLSDTLTSIGPSPNPNSEGRRPQEIRTPKLESKATSAKQQPLGSGHYRVSDFGLLSGFGFRYSDFRAAAGLWSNPDGQLLPRASNLLQARSLASTRSGGFGVACTCLGGLVTNHESRITPGFGRLCPAFLPSPRGCLWPSLAGAHLRDAVESLSQNPNQGGRASSRALIPEDPRRCLGSRGRLPSRTGSFGTISGPSPYQNFPAACDQAEPWQRVAGMAPSVLRLCSFTPWKNFVGFSRPRVFNR